ncbi:hypothetical protein PT974_04166 [Cladobotryum mycophilum]|uniref:Casein kinase substrate phosphoprotein PP28 domain-containing protein n=1 Tax=Cladobotryum mycophilum TaxID=491253 RepID=A0ABR0SUF0_9HYPO
MPAGAPGANSRGRGGKFKKFSRGGGKQFSRDLQPVDAAGNLVSMWSEEARDRSSGDESSSEEDSEEEDKAAAAAGETDASREARKAQKKARKEAAIAKSKAKSVEVGDLPSSDEESDDDTLVNPNHSAAARKQTDRPATVEDITEGVKQLPGNRPAKERYMQLSTQGKTDTAKADLARLKLIREQREIEAARRQAEKEEREEQESKKRAEIEAREAKRREIAAGPKKTSKKK